MEKLKQLFTAIQTKQIGVLVTIKIVFLSLVQCSGINCV